MQTLDLPPQNKDASHWSPGWYIDPMHPVFHPFLANSEPLKNGFAGVHFQVSCVSFRGSSGDQLLVPSRYAN